MKPPAAAYGGSDGRGNGGSAGAGYTGCAALTTVTFGVMTKQWLSQEQIFERMRHRITDQLAKDIAAYDGSPGAAKEVSRGLAAGREMGIDVEGTTSGELGSAWEHEIQNRLRQAETGTAELIPGVEVFTAIEAELRARRARR